VQLVLLTYNADIQSAFTDNRLADELLVELNAWEVEICDSHREILYGLRLLWVFIRGTK
jgi:hypothetical protein